MSKEETSGGEGVEVVKNEPFENAELGKGQYTYKIYHVAKYVSLEWLFLLGSHVVIVRLTNFFCVLKRRTPGWIQKLIPANLLDFHEEAWNAYPFCKTVISVRNILLFFYNNVFFLKSKNNNNNKKKPTHFRVHFLETSLVLQLLACTRLIVVKLKM